MSDYHTVGSPAVEVGVIEIDEILYKNLITTDNFHPTTEEKGIMKKDNVILSSTLFDS